MSGTEDTWFEADALPVDGSIFELRNPAMRARPRRFRNYRNRGHRVDLPMAAAPAIVQFVGGTPDELRQYDVDDPVTFGRNNAFRAATELRRHAADRCRKGARHHILPISTPASRTRRPEWDRSVLD